MGMRSALYLKKTYKFVLDLSKMSSEPYASDERNGNIIRKDAMQKDMENVNMAFQTIPKERSNKRGLSMSTIMYNFHRMPSLVAECHMTQTNDFLIYSSLVSRETVHVAHTMVALHDLEVKAADILNACVTDNNHKKVWTVLGPEFADDDGKSAVIIRVLYGLKSAVATLWVHLAQCITELWYHPCEADPDLWMKAEYWTEDKLH